MAEPFNPKDYLSGLKTYSKPEAGAISGGSDLSSQDRMSYLIQQGRIKPDLSTTEGKELAIKAAGYKPPTPATHTSALSRVAGVLNVGTAATSGFVKGALTGQNPFRTAGESISKSASGEDITGFSDTYRAMYGAPKSDIGKALVATGGFIADILFDPLTYLTFGLGAGAKVATRGGIAVLEKAGTKTFQEISLKATEKFGQKGLGETRLLFSEALGKKGITEEARQKLLAKGWDDATIKRVVAEAPTMIDKGGIKFAGKTLIGTDTIAKSPIGRALKVVSESEAITKLKEGLGKTFVPDFMKNPKIVSIIDKGGREIGNAFEGILKTNEKLFKGLSEEQMTRLFTAAWDKKVKVAHSGELIDQIAKGMDPAAWLKKGIQNPYDEAGGLTAKARIALEGDAKKESKRLLQGEKITFEDDAMLQKVSDDLFEPKVIDKKLPDGTVVKEVQPSITARYAKLAGIPDEDAIKFYIPSKFQEFLEKTGSGVAPSGVSSAKGGYLKKFTGAERADQVKDPFELYTRGQIEVVTDRIKTDMANAVVRELGIPLNQMTEEMAKRLGYVKFERKALGTLRETTARNEAITKLVDIKQSMKRFVSELKGTVTRDKEVSAAIKAITESIDELNSKTAKGLSKFFSEGTVSEVTSKAASRTRTIPDELKIFEKEIKTADKYKPSIKLELAFEDGTLERNGFSSIKDFVDSIKTPFSKVEGGVPRLEVEAGTDIKKVADLQKKVTQLKEKLGTLSDMDKPSVTDALDNLTRQIDELTTTKKAIRESGVANAPKVTGWIPKEINDEISKFYAPSMGTIDNLAKVTGFDYATGLFKGYVTSLFPSFHIRNMTSNTFQNMLKIGVDALNPYLHNDAIALVFGRNLDKQITTKTGKVIKLGEIRRMINKESNILSAGAFGKMEQFIEEGGERAIKGGKEAGRFNPLSRNNLAFKAGQALGTKAEQEAKVVNVLSNIMQGKTVKEAVTIADETLFNYSKLTEFERSVMRRVIPFYTFARKNAELQIKALAHTPGAVAAQLKGIKAVGEAVGDPITEEDKKGLPGYVLDSLGIKAGVNQYGQNTFITGFGLPIEEFLGRFSGDKGIVSNVVSNLMTQMNPLVKFPAEKATGQDFFQGRPITEINNGQALKPFLDVLPEGVANQFKEILEYREIPGQPVYVDGVKTGTRTKIVANPFALHFMRNLFTARIQATVGFLSSEDETTWNKTLKFFTGVKGWSIDQEQQKYYNDIKRSNELEEFLVRMGLAKKFESLYVPKKKPY